MGLSRRRCDELSTRQDKETAMQSNADTTMVRAAGQPAAGALMVRLNGMLFYSLSTASFLESTVATTAERLLYLFGADPAMRDWIEKVWWPRKLARARELRAYVEATWPEFDWGVAYEGYYSALRAHGGYIGTRTTAAREALAQCVASAQAAVFYRCLGTWTDDGFLRLLAERTRIEEAEHFERFRAAFERRGARERVGMLAAWRLTQTCVRGARDVNLRIAFEAVDGNWYGNQPFPASDYTEFLGRARTAVCRHARLGLPPRVVFRHWKGAPSCVRSLPRPVAGAARADPAPRVAAG
jgi:hypothetical protein